MRDGEEAINYLLRRGAYANRGEDPKLVMLDLKLPRVDGLDVLRFLKSLPDTASIPVIVLTGSTEERHLIESYQLGAVGYLTKPIGFAAFVEVVVQVGRNWAVMGRHG